MVEKVKKIIKEIFHYEGSFIQRYRKTRKMKIFRGEKGRQIQSVGMDELKAMFDVAERCNVDMWLEFGTLLGAYREHSFISHDFDLDVGMMQTDYTLDFENELLAVGFTKKRAFYKKNMSDGKEVLTEVTLTYKGSDIDIFFSFNEEGYRQVLAYGVPPIEEEGKMNNYSALEFQLPSFSHFQSVEINECKFNSPGDPVEVLTLIYGQNFMIPDSNWITTKMSKSVKHFDYNTVRGIMKGVW